MKTPEEILRDAIINSGCGAPEGLAASLASALREAGMLVEETVLASAINTTLLYDVMNGTLRALVDAQTSAMQDAHRNELARALTEGIIRRLPSPPKD